jgi:arylsulfatase A-like enzyme
MPNLNRLAEEGTVFERAYVTQPVCTPSRSSILTGLYPHTNGCTANNVPLPEEVRCFPEMLREGEYATAYHGKWHLGDEIFPQHGFEEWRSIEDMYHRYYRPGRDLDARSSYHHYLMGEGFEPENQGFFGRGQCARLPEKYGKPAYLAREASRFIREHAHEPFALFVNFLEPHMPFTGPRDGQYRPSDIDLPGNFDDPPTQEQPLKTRIFQQSYYERGHGGLSLRTEADWRKLISNYWGLCSLVDTHAGTMIEALRECGVYNDTIIVFTSDHGDMMGSHRLLAKCVMFEEAAKVPLIIRVPGQKEGARIAEPVSQIDLLPTLLDLMDEPAPAEIQGRSLRPQMEGNPVERDVFFEWNGTNSGGRWNRRNDPGRVEGRDQDALLKAIKDPVRSVVTVDGWKFNCSPMGEHELYNLRRDPFERQNLAGEGEHGNLMERLAERIRVWQGRTRDAVKLPHDLFTG